MHFFLVSKCSRSLTPYKTLLFLAVLPQRKRKTCQKMSVSGWIASVALDSHWEASLGVGLFDREINIRVSY